MKKLIFCIEQKKIGTMNDYWYFIIADNGLWGWPYGYFIDQK